MMEFTESFINLVVSWYLAKTGDLVIKIMMHREPSYFSNKLLLEC